MSGDRPSATLRSGVLGRAPPLDETDASMMVTMTAEERIQAVAAEALALSSRWAITVEHGTTGFVVRAEHPASAGVVIETGTFDERAAPQP